MTAVQKQKHQRLPALTHNSAIVCLIHPRLVSLGAIQLPLSARLLNTTAPLNRIRLAKATAVRALKICVRFSPIRHHQTASASAPAAFICLCFICLFAFDLPSLVVALKRRWGVNLCAQLCVFIHCVQHTLSDLVYSSAGAISTLLCSTYAISSSTVQCHRQHASPDHLPSNLM